MTLFDIVREFGWISKWVCSHDKMNSKTDNTFNDPFCIRDCSLFIGSTGPVFWGTGQGLFLMLPSTGHKDFLCFCGTGHELFWEKNLSNYIL